MALAPVAALVPVAAMLVPLVAILLTTGGPPPLTTALLGALLAVSLGVLVTGGLHLDGLADTADGLAAAGKRGPTAGLEVMRQGDVGPQGVLALQLVLLVQIVATAAILTTADPGVALGTLTSCVVLSRLAITWSCTSAQSPARSEGLGNAVVGAVHPLLAGVTTLVVVLTLGTCAWALQIPMAVAALALVGATLPGAWIVWRARRLVAGTTGDVLGAVVEVSLAGSLTACALMLTN